MPISQAGQLNTAALLIPDTYVNIVAPQNIVLNGVPTNIVGIVGTASWGPVNKATIVSTMTDYRNNFAAPQPRKYDMGTHVATAVLQGSSNFRCVRVTDGTDVAATFLVATNCITFTALYSGSFGNTITVTISAGSKASTFKAAVAPTGFVPEVFDNIAGAANAFWVNLAAAINNGTSVLRGASQFITATAGAGTTAPTAGTVYTLAAGTDGATTITAATLIGVDVTPTTGMYALRGSGASIALLADCDTSTTWTTQAAYGLSEGTYMIVTGPAGDTVANAGTVKATAGLDSYAVKYLHGDFAFWADPWAQQTRLVSQQGFIAGLLGNLSPEQSSLNKQVYGIAATQKTGLSAAQATVYSSAELQALITAGIDVITNPAPGGSYFAARVGHNSSSNSGTNGDSYTRMTNFIAATLNKGMGIYIGQVIDAKLLPRIKATLTTFLNTLWTQDMIGTPSGAVPFSVVCDTSNNPQSRTALGYVQADVQVVYLGITEKLLVNLEGGATVTVNLQTNPQA